MRSSNSFGWYDFASSCFMCLNSFPMHIVWIAAIKNTPAIAEVLSMHTLCIFTTSNGLLRANQIVRVTTWIRCSGWIKSTPAETPHSLLHDNGCIRHRLLTFIPKASPMLLQSYLPPPRSKTRTDRFLSVSLMYGVLFSFFAFVLFFIIPNFFPLVKKKFEKMRFNTKCAWDENRRQLSKMFKISRKQLTFLWNHAIMKLRF